MYYSSHNPKIKFVCCSFIALCMIFLSGCETSPQDLGISSSEWMALDQKQQEKILVDYRKIRAEKIANEKKNKLAPGANLLVEISGGEVMMPPFTDWESYKSFSFVISNGACKTVDIYSTDSNSKTELDSCFKHNTLYLDPSHTDLTKKQGSITINYSPLWQQGFTYTGITSNGYARLKNVNIKLMLRHKSKN